MEYLIIFLPLIGSIAGYLGRSLTKFFSEITTSIFVSLSAILSIIVFWEGIQNNKYGNYLIFEWISSGNFIANWSINIDPLSSVMLVVVTFVSALVHIYSIGYMSHDPHKPRFMSYLSLFTFSMLALVVSDNFLQLRNISINGVMGMATNTSNQKQIKEEFKLLKYYFDLLKNKWFLDDSSFKEISMGMSSDYLLAIEEGATIIRVGSKIFK